MTGCAPNCIANTRSYNGPKPKVFCCPVGRRDEWLRAIPMTWEPRGPPLKITVCERHFEPAHIIRSHVGSDGNGNMVTYPIKPKLRPGALPTIYPELPLSLQGRAPKLRESREEKAAKRALEKARQETQAKAREAAEVAMEAAIAEKPFGDAQFQTHFDKLIVTSDGGAVSSVKLPDQGLIVLNPEDIQSIPNVNLTATLINHRTYCIGCRQDFDGPCVVHTILMDIIPDPPRLPLAFLSIPEALSVHTVEETEEGPLPSAADTDSRTIRTKQRLRAGTLFGPLIAPLMPLDQLGDQEARFALWSEATEDLQVFDLRDDETCNWIKFVRPTHHFDQVNVIAYQHRGSIYLVTTKDVQPGAELRVHVKLPAGCKLPDEWEPITLIGFSAPENVSEAFLTEPDIQLESDMMSPQTNPSKQAKIPKPPNFYNDRKKAYLRHQRRLLKKRFEDGDMTREEKEKFESESRKWRLEEGDEAADEALAAGFQPRLTDEERLQRNADKKEARLLAKHRYENNEMTPEERKAHEEIKQADYMKDKKWRERRWARMTEEQKKQWRAKDQARARPYRRKKRAALRQKILRGEPLTDRERRVHETARATIKAAHRKWRLKQKMAREGMSTDDLAASSAPPKAQDVLMVDAERAEDTP